jgi:ubiquinone/menaquinone biosynthesis C-methylase UbiE
MAAAARPHRPYKGLPMEGPVAAWYARITRTEGRRFGEIARKIAGALPLDASVLEVAPGPGYLAIELARLGPRRIAGLDVSRSFVRIATENARRAGVSIDFRWGDAANMPFADQSFDFVTCHAAFKNFSDPVGALDEIHRVLRPGGTASINDLRRDASPAEIDAEVAGMGLSWPNRALTKLTFRTVLLKNAYTATALERMVAASRFGRGAVVPDGIGFELRLHRAPAKGS